MTYAIKVPLELDRRPASSDPDVRSLSRLPGFVRLEQVALGQRRYELVFEVEGGSRRDAMDAAEEMLVEYENALGAYHPRLLATVAPEAV